MQPEVTEDGTLELPIKFNRCVGGEGDCSEGEGGVEGVLRERCDVRPPPALTGMATVRV